jgi:hypothetical protein
VTLPDLPLELYLKTDITCISVVFLGLRGTLRRSANIHLSLKIVKPLRIQVCSLYVQIKCLKTQFSDKTSILCCEIARENL